MTECAETNWDLDVKHVKAHCTEKEKKTTKEQQFVLEGNEKADELAKEGAEIDGGQVAAAGLIAIKACRKTCMLLWSMRRLFMCRSRNGKTKMK